jgi:hypothetical protein
MNKKTSMTLASAASRSALLALALTACALPAQAHDYPTSDRVMYVHECMRQHPGTHYEMVNKCSCTLDKLASQLKFDEFESMVTATNANSIGGERGNAIRDVDPVQKEIRRFRDLQTAAKKSCFINDAK